MQASITSPRLCGGMLVAMPTAMPPEPLTSRFGNLAGSTDRLLAASRRSCSRNSTVSLSRSSSSALRDLGQPALGVALGRRRIAVDRTEVALAVDQRQAHGEVLRHAHQRVVDRQVAVRVELAHHLADDAGRTSCTSCSSRAPARSMPIEDAPVHGLEAVAHVGQRAGDDHAHGVIEVAALHLVGDRYRPDVAATRRRARRRAPDRCRPPRGIPITCIGDWRRAGERSGRVVEKE